MEKKGTVTPISSVFPVEEAEKASRRVQDAIAERQEQLDQLKGFIKDNTALINLVQKLPDETHHDIMVPFGKAAFFPGRLIHTNEFMVLLGEGYYVERTSKQTAKILTRRGDGLTTQVAHFEKIMQDLRAEASFFDATASESAEGLVEIREDYVEKEESDSACILKEGDAVEDDEYARIFSRIADLEKEEEEAGEGEGEEEEEEDDEEEDDEEEEIENEEDETGNESDEDEQIENELNSRVSEISINKEVRTSQVETPKVPAFSKDGPSRGDYSRHDNSITNKDVQPPEEKNSITNKAVQPVKEEKSVQEAVTTTNTAFTGSIVERTHNLGRNLLPSESRSSKPVSRFKMQRK